MVGDSFGRVADSSLGFLWKVASVIGENSVDSIDSSRSIFHSLRTKFLAYCLEATAWRMVYGCSPVLLQSFSALNSDSNASESCEPNPSLPLDSTISYDRSGGVAMLASSLSSPS